MRYFALWAVVATVLTVAACDDGPKTTTLETHTTPNNWTVIKLFTEPNGCAAYYARPVETYSEWEGFKYVVCTENDSKGAYSKTMWDTTEYTGVGKMRRARTIHHEVGTAFIGAP